MPKKEKEIKSTFTNNSSHSGILTIKDLERALKAIKEQSKRPSLVCILSRLDAIELLRKSAETRSFVWGMGTPVYQDKNVPKDVFRFQMSDGTYQDIPITNKARLLLIKSAEKEELK